MKKGYADLTVNSIIAKAGVSSATLYRRWSNLPDLVAAALRTLGPEPVAVDTGSLDGDLLAFIHYLGDVLSRDNPPGNWSGAMLRVEKNLRHSIDEIFVKPRKQVLAEILRNAHERHELDSLPPLDDCWSYISGPVYHRLHIRQAAFTAEFAADAAVMLGAGLRALASK